MRKVVVVPRSLEVELQRESSLRDGSLDLVLKAQDLRTNSMTKVILNLQMGYVEEGLKINMHKTSSLRHTTHHRVRATPRRRCHAVAPLQ